MFHCQLNSAWADGNLAEAAGQIGKIAEHPNQSQPNQVLKQMGHPAQCVPDVKVYRFNFILDVKFDYAWSNLLVGAY